MRILLLLSLVVVGCSAPCPERSIAPNVLCHQADGGALRANQPFVVTAANYGTGLEAATCEVSIDGGAITLTMLGAACPAKFSTNPVVPVTQVRCTVPALDAGDYTLNGASLSPGADDAGLPPCTS
jgi:hypothetical protein